MHRFMISADKAKIDTVKPLLKRDGMTLSSFFRKCVDDYIEANRGRSVVIDIEGIR